MQMHIASYLIIYIIPSVFQIVFSILSTCIDASFLNCYFTLQSVLDMHANNVHNRVINSYHHSVMGTLQCLQ